MIAPLAKFIDRSALQIVYTMVPQSMWREAANERDLKLEQAVQFLKGLDFIPAESSRRNSILVPTPWAGASAFPRRYRASSRRTMSSMAGYTVARTPGRKGP